MKRIALNIMCYTFMAYIMVGCKDNAAETVETEETKDTVVITPDTIFSVNTGTIFSEEFWAEVSTALDTGHVMVRFAVGEYKNLAEPIVIKDIGHPSNLLMIQAESIGRVTFETTIPKVMVIEDCENVRIRGFRFFGENITSAMEIVNSIRIKIENTSFLDLSDATYGALGIYGSATDSIVINNCRFERVGVNADSHMVWVDDGINRVGIQNTYFKDCAGSFIKLGGNLSDFGVFYLNDFISTGTYLSGINPPFIEVLARNEENPGNNHFGTNFVFVDNTFSYGNMGNQNARYPIVFHSSGFSPSDRNYHLSLSEGETLKTGSVVEKKGIMSTLLGLESSKIYYENNNSRNVEYNMIFRHSNNFGAESPWSGVADIEETTNTGALEILKVEGIVL